MRDRHRARIGIRRHRHYDDKHQDDLDHIKAAVDIFDDPEALDDSAELLQGAENGRYKVIAKAEPYKNLPVRYFKTIVNSAFTTSKYLCIVVGCGLETFSARSISENIASYGKAIFTWPS